MKALLVVALTIFAESGGEPREGKRAVASVIWNRAGGDREKLSQVCQAPRQFSCWNSGRPPVIPNTAPDLKAYIESYELACNMLDGYFVPSTDATHFYAPDRVRAPRWIDAMVLVEEIGGHRFYRETK